MNINKNNTGRIKTAIDFNSEMKGPSFSNSNPPKKIEITIQINSIIMLNKFFLAYDRIQIQ
jgi:hypothetical protein